MTEPGSQDATSMALGRTDLRVSRLGVGAMVWGDMSAAPRWNPARNAYGPTSSVEEQRAALEVSLARLQRTRIDLYQIHFPFRWMPVPTLMNLMADAVEAGKIRAVGVSNYDAEQLRVAHAELARRGVPLASNQVQYSLLHRNPETDGVLDACRELGVSLIAYMPLA